MTVFKKIKRNTVYYFARSLYWLLNVVPRSFALMLSSFAGLAAWKLVPRERHRIFRHLTLAFGDKLTVAQKNNIGRCFFVNSGKNLADVVRFKKHYHSQISKLVEVEGLEHLDRAYRRGKGIVGITGHIGNFELSAVYLQNIGYELAVIGREMYDRRLDRLIVGNREALGLTNIATTDSPKRLLSWLRQGKMVGVLIDTDSFRIRGMHIPVFGRPSYTPVGQSMLALKTGAAVVPLACLRTPDDRYKLIIRPEIIIDPNLKGDEAVYDLTFKCTKVLEDIIKSEPNQWIWLHNRWRTRIQNTP
jgi:KDO2-lipid IV(A) lauroyltransferase